MRALAILILLTLPAAAADCPSSGGTSVADGDWDTVDIKIGMHDCHRDNLRCAEIKTRVKVNGQWTIVPKTALAPKGEKALVWTHKDERGATVIDCFEPGQ
jgi:hypothetical protein